MLHQKAHYLCRDSLGIILTRSRMHVVVIGQSAVSARKYRDTVLINQHIFLWVTIPTLSPWDPEGAAYHGTPWLIQE